MSNTIPDTYTESQAAAVLGVPRSTLSWWHRNNKLRPDLVRPRPTVRPVGRGDKLYDADLVNMIADGRARIDEGVE